MTSIGYFLDGTQIDLAQISEITRPRQTQSLLTFGPRFASRWTVRLLRRADDFPIFSVFMSVVLTTVPSAIGLACSEQRGLLPTTALHVWGALHLALTLVANAPGFVLGLHYSTHVRIWKPEWAWLDAVITTGICPLFGMPAGAYYAHHILMHHKEDNQLCYDASSTLPYRRDSYLHLLVYCLRYIALIWIELPLVLLLRGRLFEFCRLAALGGGYLFILHAGLRVAPLATTYLLLLPLLIVSFALMRGNHLQHIFVSAAHPASPYRHSYDLCNCPTNMESFNDGFHIEHHLSPLTPWYLLPQKFIELLPRHCENDSLIFSHITPDEIHEYVFRGNLEKLADHYVYIGQASGVDRDTLIAELRRRLLPNGGLTDLCSRKREM
jgi:fatty acid desaturase